jgi:hypothetical protein
MWICLVHIELGVVKILPRFGISFWKIIFFFSFHEDNYFYTNVVHYSTILCKRLFIGCFLLLTFLTVNRIYSYSEPSWSIYAQPMLVVAISSL